jgi:CrcB protein
MNYLLVFVGGGLGAEARYWLQGLVYRLTGPGFPYGTFVVNVVGSLVIGVLVPMFEERFAVNPEVRIFLIVGILGGFTTFSSFSYETLALLREGSALTALLNVGATVATCLGATWLGMILGELI